MASTRCRRTTGARDRRAATSRADAAHLGLAAVFLCLVLAPSARASELWSAGGGARYANLDGALKWTSLLSHAPREAILYPERWSAASLWRLRLALRAQPKAWLNTEVAYEQRARTLSEASGAAGGAGVLPADIPAPYRLAQIDRALLVIGDTFSLRHELDRAYVACYFGRTEISVGRQALGWGRAVRFGAVDIFAPFGPLESDREWRRGVDAVRVRTPLTDLVALETVAALGESADASSFVARLFGYWGDIDGELIVGRRFRDHLCAGALSLPVRGAELHAEAAVFRTPEALPEGGVFGRDDLTAKLVVGGSRSFDWRAGLMLVTEYHFSGFGLTDITQAPACLLDPLYRERFLRGDSQILGRHAAMAQATYGLSGLTPITVSWILSPADRSGVFLGALTWIFSDNVTLVGSAYFAHGAHPLAGQEQSEYGGTPASGLLQISLYY